MNSVIIEGTLAAAPEHRLDRVLARVVVPRDLDSVHPHPAPGGRGPSLDVIEIVAWDHQMLDGFRSGDHVRVSGALRRTFGRVGQSVTSWVAIEVSEVTLVRRAAVA